MTVCHRNLDTARRSTDPSQEQRISEASEGTRVQNIRRWDFPGGTVVRNPPFDAGDAGSIPGLGTKIPHTTRQLSLHSANCRAHMLPHTTVRIPHATRPDVAINK